MNYKRNKGLDRDTDLLERYRLTYPWFGDVIHDVYKFKKKIDKFHFTIIFLQSFISLIYPWNHLWENVPRSTSCPDNRTWTPSFIRDPKAMASPKAQSTVRLLTMSNRDFKILVIALWIRKSWALGGPALKRFPMCVKVSSWTPHSPTLCGSFPSKNPDQGLSNQCLW